MSLGVGRRADLCGGLIHMALALQRGSVASRGQDICCWRPPAAFFLLCNGRPATDQHPQ